MPLNFSYAIHFSDSMISTITIIGRHSFLKTGRHCFSCYEPYFYIGTALLSDTLTTLFLLLCSFTSLFHVKTSKPLNLQRLRGFHLFIFDSFFIHLASLNHPCTKSLYNLPVPCCKLYNINFLRSFL